jgi:hypothetical protein
MLPEMIIDDIYSTVSQGIEQGFSDYVKGHDTSRWMLFSDYVLKDRDRPNDVFAFTLVPGGQHLNSLLAEFSATATHDFKKIREVSDSMARLLTDKRLVTLCFVVSPARVITGNVEALRGMLDDTLAMMEKWEDADGHRELINNFKAMRQKAESRSFNIRLLGDIIVATTLAAFLTYLVCKHTKVERVGWFSDRDNITTAHQRIADIFYSVNVSSCCQRLMKGWCGPLLGVNGVAAEGNSLWCDDFLRVPDYFAGAVSAWHIEQNALSSDLPKYSQVLLEAVADKPNVHIIKLNIELQGEQLNVLASRVVLNRTPA